jgi:hypothetical protein
MVKAFCLSHIVSEIFILKSIFRSLTLRQLPGHMLDVGIQCYPSRHQRHVPMHNCIQNALEGQLQIGQNEWTAWSSRKRVREVYITEILDTHTLVCALALRIAAPFINFRSAGLLIALSFAISWRRPRSFAEPLCWKYSSISIGPSVCECGGIDWEGKYVDTGLR